MIPDPSQPVHLTYCSNIHPGETWPEVRDNVEQFFPAVRERVAPGARFGVGLRLSAAAAAALADDEVFDEFAALLEQHDLYVFTLNGFPYGRFHGASVKEAVYRPDWLETERLDYTDRLADLAARFAALGQEDGVSVSTVPGAFKPRADTPAAAGMIAEALIRHAAHLVDIRRTSGHAITLALEPEPCCFLETIDETIRFFEAHLFSRAGVERLAGLTGLNATESEEVLRRHIGVCLDTCHAAVEFEDAGHSLARLDAAGVSIAKIQLSAGLRIAEVDEEMVAALTPFDDGVYLHQVIERRGQDVRRFTDLPGAIDAFRRAPSDTPASEWRIHFHVPIFHEHLGAFDSTRPFLEDVLALQKAQSRSPHLEVETYTWDALPASLRTGNVTNAIARELTWVLEHLAR